MSFGQYLNDQIDVSRRAMQGYFEKQMRPYREIDDSFNDYVDNLEPYLLSGGKWIRPLLIREAYKITGGKGKGDIVLGSVAMEMFHRFILCHDDIIDGDKKRHGRDTLERVYEKEQKLSKWPKPMKTYALGMAMEAGDLMHAQVYKMIWDSGFGPDISAGAIKALVACTYETVAGWRLESMIKQYSLAETRISVCKRSQALVSGHYSLIWPLRIGQVYGGRAYGKWIEALEAYGLNLGLAFQMQDDRLGIFGDSQKTGKPVGNDLREGKKSLVLLYAYQRASRAQKRVLEAANGNQTMSEDEVEEVRQILRETQAYEQTVAEARGLADKARKALGQGGIADTQAGKRLLELADFIVSREY